MAWLFAGISNSSSESSSGIGATFGDFEEFLRSTGFGRAYAGGDICENCVLASVGDALAELGSEDDISGEAPIVDLGDSDGG